MCSLIIIRPFLQARGLGRQRGQIEKCVGNEEYAFHQQEPFMRLRLRKEGLARSQ